MGNVVTLMSLHNNKTHTINLDEFFAEDWSEEQPTRDAYQVFAEENTNHDVIVVDIEGPVAAFHGSSEFQDWDSWEAIVNWCEDADDSEIEIFEAVCGVCSNFQLETFFDHSFSAYWGSNDTAIAMEIAEVCYPQLMEDNVINYVDWKSLLHDFTIDSNVAFDGSINGDRVLVVWDN